MTPLSRAWSDTTPRFTAPADRFAALKAAAVGLLLALMLIGPLVAMVYMMGTP